MIDQNALTPNLLLAAYASGVFPMAQSRDDPELFWLNPEQRGILPLNSFHISRSLKRAMMRSQWRIEINTDFEETLRACADRDETWINCALSSVYQALYEQGYAYSFEIRDGSKLAGGMFGIALGRAFFGESMVSCQTNGSKMALASAVYILGRSGFTLFDTQFITPHLRRLGAKEISRAQYQNMLKTALKSQAVLPTKTALTLQDVAQRMTQMS